MAFVFKTLIVVFAFIFGGLFITYLLANNEANEVRATKKDWKEEEWKEKAHEIYEKYEIWAKIGRWIGYIIGIWGAIYCLYH